MYDDLIERLRNCATEAAPCKSCDMELDGSCSDTLMKQAADAIEELSKKYLDSEVDNTNLTGWLAEEHARHLWIPVAERLPSDFVSVQAHIVGAEPLPTVREAYVIGGKWFFPALKEFLPVDMWKRFDEPPKEET